jgi:hypothetical protein
LKFIIVLSLTLLFCLNVFAQSVESGTENSVTEITLARDDGHGKPGKDATSFTTTDIPIHCLVQLASTRAVTVKMNFVAVSVLGVKANKNVVTTSYKTDGNEDGVNFNGSPAGIWTAGRYRIDILLDDKLAKSLEFDIEKSPQEIELKNQFVPKQKTKPPPKIKQKPRKS